MTERKAVIKSADMAEEMQQDSIDVATQVFQFYYPSIKNIFGTPGENPPPRFSN